MSDTERKILNLNKKLQDITKLKVTIWLSSFQKGLQEKLTAGEPLQKNQLDKISKENELLSELAALKVTE